jgi:hypothetical protein
MQRGAVLKFRRYKASSFPFVMAYAIHACLLERPDKFAQVVLKKNKKTKKIVAKLNI